MTPHKSLLVMLLLAVLPVCAACAPSTTALPQKPPTALPQALAPTALPPTSTPTSLPPTTTPTPLPPTATPTGPLAPDTFDQGGPWLNSEPLTLAELRGKVILVNFWTYGCYNCQNTLPYVRQWWNSYQDDGLVIIGVHTPELEWERPLENVQQAVNSEEIGWPVVIDNDKLIWRSYHNRYWPRFYLIDHTGHIIYDRIGEGAYDTTEQRIVAALEDARAAANTN
jgi:thiol-disulfide isomerase/thioredoxin